MSPYDHTGLSLGPVSVSTSGVSVNADTPIGGVNAGVGTEGVHAGGYLGPEGMIASGQVALGPGGAGIAGTLGPEGVIAEGGAHVGPGGAGIGVNLGDGTLAAGVRLSGAGLEARGVLLGAAWSADVAQSLATVGRRLPPLTTGPRRLVAGLAAAAAAGEPHAVQAVQAAAQAAAAGDVDALAVLAQIHAQAAAQAAAVAAYRRAGISEARAVAWARALARLTVQV